MEQRIPTTTAVEESIMILIHTRYTTAMVEKSPLGGGGAEPTQSPWPSEILASGSALVGPGVVAASLGSLCASGLCHVNTWAGSILSLGPSSATVDS